MLPSIHHLLDSEPSPGQSDNAPTSHSSPSLVPSTDHHKLPGHSQSDLTMAIEVPLPQRNEPQFRQTQHYPHPPYEPLAPPHLYPQEHDHNGEPLSKTAPVPRLSFSYQSHSSRRHINKNGYTKDFDRYYQPTPIDTTMSSPIDTDPTRKAGSPLSPRIRSRNSEYADMPSDPYAPGPLAPAWPSRSSQDSKPVSPYRSHRRGSPFDPSGSSSSSSTSPSPSISTATAASTPLTTEGISAVTKGTASATINDTRSKYGPGQPRGRGAIRGDYKELTSDRYAASLDYPDRTDTPFKDIGGLVQPAPNDAHSSSPYSRSNSQEMGSYRYESQQSPQLHPNEPNMNGSTNGTRRYSPDMYHKHPSHQARLISTSPPELRYSSLHDSRIPATHVHSSAPSSPSQRSNGSAHEISSRGTERVGDPSGEYYRDDRRHMDTEQDLYRQEQGRRYGSLSSPGPGSVNTLQLSMNPPPRQSNSTSHPSHHQSHPSLHQEQHSPPLHDPVRESDHRTFQQSTNQSSAHLSSHVRQPEHEQASRLSHRQRFVSANGVPFESRQPGFDQQRSTTGSTRIASPTSSHPYHGFSHPRSHSQSTNGKEYRDFKDQGPPSNHPRNLAFSSMSPEDKHPNSAMLNHRRHASQGYDRTGHVEAQGPGSDSHLESRGTRHGGWSHGSSDYDSARLEEEEACQTRPSSMASVHWREERRIIRLSVSESDLHAIDPDSRRGRHAREYPEDDVDEDVEDLGEDEEFEEEEEERMLGHLHRPEKHQSRPYEYEHESEYARYGPRHPEDSMVSPSHRGPHYSYEGSSMHRHSRDYPIPQSHLQNGPQHPQSYPPRPHQHPHGYQHPGGYQQHSMMGQSTMSITDPTLTSPRMPSRRGPYMSRSRVQRAGLETVPLSSRYQCQYCSKRFSRPSSLRIHTYSHTGERPFKCSEEGCGRQFSVQSNMRRHLRVHRLGRMRNESQD